MTGGTSFYNGRTDTRLPYLLSGDGVTDCLAGLNADIIYISGQGGGVLYLPAGNYPAAATAANSLNILSNVILAGDTGLVSPTYVSGASGLYQVGQVRTVLGYSTAANYAITLNNVSNVCLQNLTLRNVAPLAQQPNYRAFFLTQGSAVSNVALREVEWIAGDDGGMHFVDATGQVNLAVECCLLDGTAQVSVGGPTGYAGGLFSADGWANATMVGCHELHHNGRLRWIAHKGGYFRGNTVYLSGGPRPNAFERGPVDFSYTHGNSASDPYIIELNAVGVTGFTVTENCGEPMAFQNDGGASAARQNFRDRGHLSAVGAPSSGTVTFTDGAKNWTGYAPPAGLSNLNGWPNSQGPLEVVIVGADSPALGQSYPVTAHAASTVTCAILPGQPVPSVNDPYVITTHVARDVVIRNNVLVNNFHETVGGWGLYGGGYNVTFDGNTGIDSGGPQLNGWDDGDYFNPVYFCTVKNTKVDNPNGRMLSTVGTSAIVPTATPFGILFFGNQFYATALSPTVGSAATGSPKAFGPANAAGVYQSVGSGSAAGVTFAQVSLDAPFPGVTNGRGPVPIPVYNVPTVAH